jgi:hypothetical protein
MLTLCGTHHWQVTPGLGSPKVEPSSISEEISRRAHCLWSHYPPIFTSRV